MLSQASCNSHSFKLVFFNQSKAYVKKVNVYLPYNLAIPPPDIYLREMKTYVHQNPCTVMFIPAFLVIAPNWKQLRCSLKKRMGKQWNSTQ